jgi:hypothetical protein
VPIGGPQLFVAKREGMGTGGTVAAEMGWPRKEGEGRARARVSSLGEFNRPTGQLRPEGGRGRSSGLGKGLDQQAE